MYENSPKFLFMEVNKSCNLKCNHCNFWKRDDKDERWYINSETKRILIEEFSQLSGSNGSLVICGGEPMLDIDKYYEYCRLGRKNSLRVLSVVNGTRIKDEQSASRVILEGPHEISISLDDFDPEIHNEMRGTKHAFNSACTALRNLVKIRNSYKTGKVHIMGLVHAKNYERLEGFYDFALNEIGVNKLKLNFLQPTFGGIGNDDVFNEYGKGIDPEKLFDIMKICENKYGINFNPEYLQTVHHYWDSVRKNSSKLIKGWGETKFTEKPICNTYERNIMINHYGMARLCFNGAFPGRFVVKEGDLTSFWQESNSIREMMKTCTRQCGISHSVRRESALIKLKIIN